MSLNVGKSSSHNFSIQELLEEAKVLEFSCTLSTKEEECYHKTTLTLFTDCEKWYLSGYPLTKNSSSLLDDKFFEVDNFLQLLLGLSANLFPQHICITHECYNLKIYLYIYHIDECYVKEWKSNSKYAK